jgi:hypothetical protein
MGAFLTAEQAISDGRRTYEPDEPFYVCRGVLADSAKFLPTVSEIEEIIRDTAFIEVGEAAEDFPDLSEKAKEELGIVLRAWATIHLKPNFWIPDRKPWRIDPRSPPPCTLVGQPKTKQ